MGVVVISGRRFDTRAIQQLVIHTALMGVLPIVSYYAGRHFYIENLQHLDWDPEFFAAGVAIFVVQLVIARFVYVAVTEQDEPEDIQEKQEKEKEKSGKNEKNETGGTEDVNAVREENGVECADEEVKREGEGNRKTVESLETQEAEVGQVSAASIVAEEKKTQ